MDQFVQLNGNLNHSGPKTGGITKKVWGETNRHLSGRGGGGGQEVDDRNSHES